ncbi:hypothetical protein ACFX2J_029341 [Malus domestica]
MAIWVRILGVLIEYFNVCAMRKIGNVLGKLLKIDIDVTKPLEAFIQINSRWYNLKYEGMPKICLRCGRYGHKRESCPWSVDRMVENVDGGENESNIIYMDEPIVKYSQSSDDVYVIQGTWMQGSSFSALNGEDKSLNEGNMGSGTNVELAACDLDPVKFLGFPCFEIVDDVGFSSGLWMLWKDSRLKVEVICTTDPTISVVVRGVADCHQLPWLIARDFNDMLCVEDKLGGAPLCRSIQRLPIIAMWLRHENFKELLMVIGVMAERKHKLLTRIDGIKKALCRGPNKFLSKLEDELISENNDVLNEEAIFWHQKSRLRWLQEELFDLKKLAVEYYQTIFSHGQKSKQMESLPNLFPDIHVADREALTKDINIVEVKESLFNIGGLKALGVDGFPACFY